MVAFRGYTWLHKHCSFHAAYFEELRVLNGRMHEAQGRFGQVQHYINKPG